MRLAEKYKKQIVFEMMKKFGYKSPMAVPKVEKISVNSGFGKMIVGKTSGEREKAQRHIVDCLSVITGQQPSLRQAKKSIAAFKLRANTPIGATATLRGKRMYQFLEKLINLVLPRMRDFRGIPLRSVTDKGDVTIGFKEITSFPEIKVEREKSLFGLEVTITTTSKTKKEGVELLRMLGMPLQKNG